MSKSKNKQKIESLLSSVELMIQHIMEFQLLSDASIEFFRVSLNVWTRAHARARHAQ